MRRVVNVGGWVGGEEEEEEEGGMVQVCSSSRKFRTCGGHILD